jgi:hypothetical protein
VHQGWKISPDHVTTSFAWVPGHPEQPTYVRPCT